MQNQINLSDSHFIRLPVRQPREPRGRFVRYYQDLYSVYGGQLAEQTFFTGSQYSYTELGDGIFANIAKNTLNQIDLFVMVAWAHEFDPDYASAGTYFAHRYQLSGKMLDVSDQGTLGFFTALDLVKKYLQASQAKNALIIVLEQTTIPCSKDVPILPLHDAAFGLLISENSLVNENTKYEIVLAEIKQKEKMQSIDKLILEICNAFAISQHQIKLIFKNNSTIHQQYLNSYLNITAVITKILPNYPGIFPLLSYLHDLTECRDAADFILMLDEDAETTDIGYVMLRRCK